MELPVRFEVPVRTLHLPPTCDPFLALRQNGKLVACATVGTSVAVVVDGDRPSSSQRLALVLRPGALQPSQEDLEAVLRRWFDGPVCLQFVSEPPGVVAVAVIGAAPSR